MTTTPSPEALADLIERELGKTELVDASPSRLRRLKAERIARVVEGFRPTPTDSGEVVQGEELTTAEIRKAYEAAHREADPWNDDRRSYALSETGSAYASPWVQTEFAQFAFGYRQAHRLAFSRPEPVGDEALVEAVRTHPTGAEQTLAEIAEMMAKHVENWPNPKTVSTAIALIDKTLAAALDDNRPEPGCPRAERLHAPLRYCPDCPEGTACELNGASKGEDEALVERVAAAIEDVAPSHHIKLIGLIDGVSTYRLTVGDEEPREFVGVDAYSQASEHLGHLIRLARARAAIQAIPAPATGEREQIVGWLRADADLTEIESRKILSNSHGLSPRDVADWQNLIATKRGIADAIARGDHRTQSGEMEGGEHG